MAAAEGRLRGSALVSAGPRDRRRDPSHSGFTAGRPRVLGDIGPRAIGSPAHDFEPATHPTTTHH
jgi:hypothetical protein